MNSAIPDTTVLIPAAGRVPEGVLALSNIGSPAMIPVAGRPVIHWTIQYLSSLGLTKYVVAVPRRGLFVEDYVQCVFGGACQVDFIVPSMDGGVGRTVMELAERVKTQSALVVLGDTYFRFDDPGALVRGEPAVLVHPVEDSYRWCVVETDEAGHLTRLHDKDPTVRGGQRALIGVYHFPDAARLRKAAGEACAEAEGRGARTELAAILERVHAETPIRVLPAGEWLDCGNPDRQAASHQALLQARAFNELEIDPVFGAITKRSRNVEKFIDEINYLRLLPPELGVLFPRVLGYSTDWQDPWVRMEYYGYPSLSEVFVFENLDPGVWEQVFRHLRRIVEDGFLRHTRPLPQRAVREMYLEKTKERLARLAGHETLGPLVTHEGTLVVNGAELRNLPLLWHDLEREIARLEETATGSIVHGDLCLSNILYDLRSRIVKLIDPRGSFGGAGIYGDVRYDVAKLYHSVYGHYDLIVNDLFEVEVNGLEVSLHVRTQPRHGEIRERFEAVFFPAFSARDIKLVTGLLFASMPALHYDAPRRQVAMYVRALQILNEVLGPEEASRQARAHASRPALAPTES